LIRKEILLTIEWATAFFDGQKRDEAAALSDPRAKRPAIGSTVPTPLTGSNSSMEQSAHSTPAPKGLRISLLFTAGSPRTISTAALIWTSVTQFL
jgi:hypothetical protein